MFLEKVEVDCEMDIGWPACLFQVPLRPTPRQGGRIGKREKLGLVVFPTNASSHPAGSSGVGVTFGLFLVRAGGP